MAVSSFLVVGLGFLGQPLVKTLAAQGHRVIAVSQTRESWVTLQSLPNIELCQADVADDESVQSLLRTEGAAQVDWIVHCASSGRGGPEAYRRVYLNGIDHLRKTFPSARLLFTSSTSVYAQSDGSWVDEASPAEPDRETGRLLRKAEDLVLEAGGLVTRLAGIYGPGRSHILAKYLQGSAVIEGDGGRYLNQAHVEDIVSALVHLMDRGQPGLFNVVDSTPQTQRQLFGWLADHFRGALPPQAPPDYERKRGWTHKRVANAALLSTGWRPRYPSYQDAILHDPDLVPSIRRSLASPDSD